MLNIAVCDDDQYYADKIKKMVEDILNNKGLFDYKIDVFLSGVKLCSRRSDIAKYKIIFMDINMQGLNGIETAEKIRVINQEAFLVFVTSYADYAIEGYRVDAFRFIIKDILDKMLIECMDCILSKLRFQDYKIEYLFLEGKKEIYVNKISYIESKKHKLYFNIPNENIQYSIYKKLDSLETDLKPYEFLRIHKSYLVNINYIEDIADYSATLKTGIQLPIPRAKYQEIKELFFTKEGEF